MPKLISHLKNDSLTARTLHFFTMVQSLKPLVAFALPHIREQYPYPRGPLSPTNPAYAYVAAIPESSGKESMLAMFVYL
jgi:hypothetical protein